jgi:TP901 family phage tail tape measure protein
MAEEKVGDLYVKLSMKADEFRKDWDKSVRVMEQGSQKMLATSARLTIGLTAPLTLIGRASFNEFRQFDKAMTQSTAIMENMTEKVKKGMAEQAKALSLDGSKSAVELAQSYYFLASAGLDANEAMANLPTVTKFATAGVIDMDKAVSLLVTSQKGLGLATGNTMRDMVNMERVASVLLKANTLADASTQQFAAALANKAAPALRLMNKEIEEGVAVLSIFAQQGIKGARGGTFLEIAMRELTNKSLKNREAFKELGIEVFNTNGEMNHMADIVEDLEGAFGKMTPEAQTASLAQLGFSQRSVFAIRNLIGFSDAIRENEARLKSVGGILQDMSDKQLASFDKQIEALGNKFDFIQHDIGQQFVPAIQDMNEAMKIAIIQWKQLDEETKKWVVQLGTATAAIGPVLGVLGGIGLLLPALGKGLAMLAVFAGKIALPIAAIVAVFDYFAANDFGSKMQLVTLEIESAWKELEIHLGFIADTILNDFDGLWDTLQYVALEAAIGTKNQVQAIFETLVNEASAAWSQIKQMVTEDPFLASQEARKNISFARMRLTEVGLDPSEVQEKGSRKRAFSLIDQTGKTREDMQLIVDRLDDFFTAVQAQTDAHNVLMKAKAERQAEFDKKLSSNPVYVANLKKRNEELAKLDEARLKKGGEIASKMDAESFNTFAEHLAKRIMQIEDFTKVDKKEWNKIVKQTKESFNEIEKGNKQMYENMTEEGYQFSARMEEIFQSMKGGFDSAWEGMFNSMIDGTATLEQAFQQLGMEILKVIMQQALIKPVSSALGGGTLSMTKGIFGGIGGLFGGGTTTMSSSFPTDLIKTASATLAKGGIMNSPTPFSMGNKGFGVAGEAGPEAALPLTRGADGNLGVSLVGASGGGDTYNQTFNISTPNADSFKLSERQIKRRMRN